jgi:hypothetical protein
MPQGRVKPFYGLHFRFGSQSRTLARLRLMHPLPLKADVGFLCEPAGERARYVEESAGESRRCDERCRDGAAVAVHHGEVADRCIAVPSARFTYGGEGRQRKTLRHELDRLALYAARLKPPLRWALRLYGNIGHSSREHSSQPFSSRAASRERPRSIADLILWQRTQSGLPVILAILTPGQVPVGHLRLLSYRDSMCLRRISHRSHIKVRFPRPLADMQQTSRRVRLGPARTGHSAHHFFALLCCCLTAVTIARCRLPAPFSPRAATNSVGQRPHILTMRLLWRSLPIRMDF